MCRQESWCYLVSKFLQHRLQQSVPPYIFRSSGENCCRGFWENNCINLPKRNFHNFLDNCLALRKIYYYYDQSAISNSRPMLTTVCLFHLFRWCGEFRKSRGLYFAILFLICTGLRLLVSKLKLRAAT